MKIAKGIHAYHRALQMIMQVSGISIDAARHHVIYVEPSGKGKGAKRSGAIHAHMSNVRRARKVANVKARSKK